VPKKNLLILGGGCGGLACLRTLARRLDLSKYAIQLVDETPYHAIKSRFHEWAVLQNTARKVKVRRYLDRYGPPAAV
jgi:NADH dehydrogenase FAD-containing subunit